MVHIQNRGKTKNYVYDISLDGTVVNALGMGVMSNTDGFNFQMPKDEDFRYNDEHPYVSNGRGRNSVEGKRYTKVEGDVAEFEDMFFSSAWNGGINKMGLGVDEYCLSTINFARKNYADYMPDGSTKLVGNSIKSRKMSGYLDKFLTQAVDQLLHGKGKEFLEWYYEYIERIYNYKIPIKDIASKGNIKKTIEDYKKDCNQLTKAGNKKSRQAWYELVIRDNVKVNVSDTIYYVNTGQKKSDSDVKRITHQYVDFEGNRVELNAKIKRLLLQPECEKEGIVFKNLKEKEKKERLKKYIKEERDEILINCQLVPNEILNSDRDILCSESEELGFGAIEYNVEKYIQQFNNRIKPLLVCFSTDIRSQILITNPSERKYFTEEQSKLVSGQPNKPEDQDTFEALMTPERKEIEFWDRINETPPFVKECGIDWDNLLKKYAEEKKKEEDALFIELNNKYLDALEKLTNKDVEAFYDDGVLPNSISSIMYVGEDARFYFKDIEGKAPSTGGYIFDDMVVTIRDVDEDEAVQVRETVTV